MKDIAMAQQANVSDVFAKYGTAHFNGNDNGYNLLRAVTHWTDEDVEREKKIKEENHHIPPTDTVDQFKQILTLFEFFKFGTDFRD